MIGSDCDRVIPVHSASTQAYKFFMLLKFKPSVIQLDASVKASVTVVPPNDMSQIYAEAHPS